MDDKQSDCETATSVLELPLDSEVRAQLKQSHWEAFKETPEPEEEERSKLEEGRMFEFLRTVYLTIESALPLAAGGNVVEVQELIGQVTERTTRFEHEYYEVQRKTIIAIVNIALKYLQRNCVWNAIAALELVIEMIMECCDRGGPRFGCDTVFNWRVLSEQIFDALLFINRPNRNKDDFQRAATFIADVGREIGASNVLDNWTLNFIRRVLVLSVAELRQENEDAISMVYAVYGYLVLRIKNGSLI